MSKKVLVLLGLFLINFLALNGQQRRVSKADTLYKKYSFIPAIDIYKEVLDEGYESSEILKKLGNSYYFNSEYREACVIYERLLEGYPNDVTPDYYFRCAQAFKTQGEYQKSDGYLNQYFAASKEHTGIKPINSADYLTLIKQNSGRFDVRSFKYNSEYSDFAPSFYKKDSLLFASDRDTGNLAKYRHTWNAHDFLDIYQVEIDEEGINDYVYKIGGDINTRLHESTSIITKDGRTMYFTRNNFLDRRKSKKKDKIIRLKIFRATWVDDKWTNIMELPFNSEDYSVAHPALTPDESELYFTSDMPKGDGDSNLFKVVLNEDGSFGEISKLGQHINTTARETFPFIASDSILYFASDGHPGLGGFDVFATQLTAETNEEVINLGEPVNSSSDDFSFIIDAEKKSGYFASNRAGGIGDDDIYEVYQKDRLPFKCLTIVTGTVRDKITNQVLADAEVKVINENDEEEFSTRTSTLGTYQLELDCNKGNFIRAVKEGYIPSEEFVAKAYNDTLIVDLYLEPKEIQTGGGDDLAKLLQLSTIYFDLNKYSIRKDAEIEIQKIIAAMKKYPSLKIQVNSHTDSRGDDDYNLWLSEKRSEATVAYMIENGIASDRLESKGYGEQRLVNNCTNNSNCTSKQHQLNRRSEFIILN